MDLVLQIVLPIANMIIPTLFGIYFEKSLNDKELKGLRKYANIGTILPLVAALFVTGISIYVNLASGSIEGQIKNINNKVDVLKEDNKVNVSAVTYQIEQSEKKVVTSLSQTKKELLERMKRVEYITGKSLEYLEKLSIGNGAILNIVNNELNSNLKLSLEIGELKNIFEKSLVSSNQSISEIKKTLKTIESKLYLSTTFIEYINEAIYNKEFRTKDKTVTGQFVLGLYYLSAYKMNNDLNNLKQANKYLDSAKYYNKKDRHWIIFYNKENERIINEYYNLTIAST